MLKSIRLKNFKLHEDTSIEAARINVFIGPNNSGKSSIFQALLALRQAASQGSSQFLLLVQRQPTSPDQPYLFPALILDIGEFKDIVRQGEDEILINVSGATRLQGVLKNSADVSVNFEVRVRQNILGSHSGSIETASNKISWAQVSALPTQDRHSISVEGISLGFMAVNSFQLVSLTHAGPFLNTAPDRQAAITQFGNYFADAPRRLLDSLHPVFPLRGFEEWGYPVPQDRPASTERMILPDRAYALVSTLALDRRLREELSQRLEELIRIRVETELVPGKRVKLWTVALGTNGRDTLFVNEGTGANQLPFILVPIALASPNDTILLSEPEAHLHPKAQSELMALLLTIAKKQNLQFFIETHSEHVLHKLLHAVAKRELARDDVALYYFENHHGAARVRHLEIDEKGGVQGGLPGFFDQSLTELTEYLDALGKK